MGFGQVFADRNQPCDAIEEAAIGGMVAGTHRDLARNHADQGGLDRAAAARGLEGIAAQKTARSVGLIKLLTPDRIDRASMAIERRLEATIDAGIGMEHQIAPDQATRIGQAIGMA